MRNPVGVSVRFVPAGLCTVDDKLVLRGTLVLAPAAGSEAAACGSPVDLANWLEGIERLVKERDVTQLPGNAGEPGPLAILISPVRDFVKASTRPAPTRTESPRWLRAYRAYTLDHPAASRARAKDERAEQAIKARKLWGRLMAPTGVEWDHLVEALRVGTGASKTSESDSKWRA